MSQFVYIQEEILHLEKLCVEMKFQATLDRSTEQYLASAICLHGPVSIYEMTDMIYSRMQFGEWF